ncbi:hypothetical protein QQZ08_004626 [Neonectria magnoliae]|uniref:Xylanolytic transcriptional activator regulatory domain-containing protein n=1 Tax=Neonectria magnoliae TaxID=2732573 RepID=A0ABR1I692_9HYPO
MLAVFRDAGLFEEQYDLAQDDPQGAIPSSWLRREKLKRLAFFSFRLDIYFYFLRGHNPTLRYDELSLTTPCSEKLWDAQTAEEWHQVKRIESQKRTPMRFMNLVDIALDREGRAGLPSLLEDEYFHGLCAMQIWLWRDINRSRSLKELPRTFQASGICSRPAISRAIDFWAMQLTIWRDCLRSRALGSLLSSQKHREMTESSAILLYHLSQMSLRADLKVIKDVSLGQRHPQYSGNFKRQLESTISEWAKSPDARQAMWHSAQVLKLLQRTARQSETGEATHSSSHIGFIVSIALYEAGLVAWAYARSVQIRLSSLALSEEKCFDGG